MKSMRITKAELEIHDDLVIARFDEASDILSEDFIEIKKTLSDNFNAKFAWISDRINSYSVDPTLLTAIFKDVDNLVCLAQVNYGKKIRDSTDIAKSYTPTNKPFHSFTTLDEALDWAKKKLHDAAV